MVATRTIRKARASWTAAGTAADGTSFAAPFVTGVAAVLWARSPHLTAEQIKTKLVMSCDDVERPGWDILTGAGRLNAAKALTADPDHFLHTALHQVTLSRVNGQPALEVFGTAAGTHFRGRWLQVAFGEYPAENAWTTIQFSREPVRDGTLGYVPGDRLDRRGVWCIRSLVDDSRGLVRQSRMVVDLR